MANTDMDEVYILIYCHHFLIYFLQGTEASHMHNSWEENYQRGYEWWVMKEAKKASIKVIFL